MQESEPFPRGISTFLACVPVACTAPFVHASPWLTARLFESFARSEWESMLDLREAAARTPSAERAARYLAHAADEVRHTRMFAKRAGELGQVAQAVGDRVPFGDPSRVEAQVAPTGLGQREEIEFLAFVHHGEARALAQLETRIAILDAAGDPRSAALCRRVAEDERNHAAYTWELLVELAGAPGTARKALRRAQAGEVLPLWRAAGGTLTAPLFSLLATALYCLVGPLAALSLAGPRQKRLSPP
jgi:rubrerythrin